MPYSLNSQNVFSYLTEGSVCQPDDFASLDVELKPAKNFNLLLRLKDGRQLLVKQERRNQAGKTAGEFLGEWKAQELLTRFPEVGAIKGLFPEILHFDREDSIIVVRYLDDYQDLSEFYAEKQQFPPRIATEIGVALAKIHRLSYRHSDMQSFLHPEPSSAGAARQPMLSMGLDQVGPEVFGIYPADGLKFLALYQRFDSLGQAIAELSAAYQPGCLTHNDLKLNNILLHQQWALNPGDPPSNPIRLIDWERCGWGDPAFDVGCLLAGYLQLWLASLVVSKGISIDESLRMAITPLDVLQPSLAALMVGYLEHFPEILPDRPQFLQRAVQFAGLGLIQQIQSMILYQKSFGNTGICMLQVAKSLLCRPEASVPTVFGNADLQRSPHATAS
jgi:Phosphotransferase enzyme family